MQEFVTEMRAVLFALGAPITKFEDNWTERGGYSVNLNEVKYMIKTDEEVQRWYEARRAKRHDAPGEEWISCERTLKMLVQHLVFAGVPETVYTSYPEDPMLAAFLTKEMGELIASSKVGTREMREILTVEEFCRRFS